MRLSVSMMKLAHRDQRKSCNKLLLSNKRKYMVEGCYIWQDREVKFDMNSAELQLRKGEAIVDSINAVEDTKGNNGERGNMLITNLRIIWFNDADQRTNLSIGYDCITSVEIKTVESRLKGSCQALAIKTRYNQSRFEFVFTSLFSDSPRLFTSFQAVVRSYETTKIYRDLRLRSAIIQENMLTLLPQEHVYNKYMNVWNISVDQKTAGTMVVTNVRLAWFAQLNESFNVSVPWVQISKVKIRDSTYGKAMVVETQANNNGYTAGFRLEDYERVFTELTNLLKVHSENPVLGVETVVEEKSLVSRAEVVPRVMDDVQIVGTGYKTAAAYSYMTQSVGQDRRIVFSPELGLAMEEPPEGATLEDLWRVIA